MLAIANANETPYKTPPPPIARGHALLIAFFRSGVTLGDKSPFGSVLDRAMAFADGYDESSGTRIRIRMRRCTRCAGETIDTRKLAKWRERKAHFELLFDSDFVQLCPPPNDDCPRCNGTGEVYGSPGDDTVTVWPMGSSKTPWQERREPNDDSLMRLAKASRTMLQVGRINRFQQGALLLYYGDHGDHCEAKHGNRLVSVMPLAWAVAMKRIQKHDPLETYAWLIQKARSSDQSQRVVFSQGEALAHKLLCDAIESWDACVFPTPESPTCAGEQS